MFSSPFYVFHSCSNDAFNGEKETTYGCQAYKEVSCPGHPALNEDHIYTVPESWSPNLKAVCLYYVSGRLLNILV